MIKVLAFLQNQWFKDPEAAQRMFDRRPDLRNEYIKRFLFMGCLTGRRLEAVLGDELCDQIIWEEASPKKAGFSSGVFPADTEHIKNSIEIHKPEVIICFGKVASDAIKGMNLTIPILYAPHPTSRQNPMPKLKEAAKALKEIIANG